MDLPQEDFPMRDLDRDDEEEEKQDEGEGENLQPGPGGLSDDSSEEEDDDEEEEKRIRDGFIVDEDEDEDDEEDDKESRRRRKRRKRHHRRRQQEEDLEDDDLELLAENTGTTYKKRGLTRLRRGRDSESPPAASSSRRKNAVASSDDDLDDDDDLPRVQDIQNIWDDDRVRDEEEDMDDFIESDEEEDAAGAVDERARAELRKKKRREAQEQRRNMRMAHSDLVGIDANDWDEIHDVFGDGHEYDWALEGDDDVPHEDEHLKTDMRYQDVFEPTEIQARHLTEDDDLIRAKDTPERMQLLYSTLSNVTNLNTRGSLAEKELNDAAMWITQRLSARKTRDFFAPDGQHRELRTALVQSVRNTVEFLFIKEFEVPHIWTHRRDYISHYEFDDKPRIELLTQSELWRIYALGMKYISLSQRRAALLASYNRLHVSDSYFEEEIQPNIDSAETVADASDWLMMRYKDKRNTDNEFQTLEDDGAAEASRKPKMPSRVSAYEMAKKSVIAKLAEAYGIKPHEIVLNFNAQTSIHFVDDPELNPIAYAEQFSDPDPSKAQVPEVLLERARMVAATELGRDPLLRHHVRHLFGQEASVSCEPTEKGKAVIDEEHPYYRFKYLSKKKVIDMLDNAMFLHILNAENQNLVVVSVTIDLDIRDRLERRLTDACMSDSFSDAAKAWNEERKMVVQEALDKHLIPAAARWVREYVKEEAGDHMATALGDQMRHLINMAPLTVAGKSPGQAPRVLAMSWGRGDPQRDTIHLAVVNEMGRLRDSSTLDNLTDDQNRDEFVDILHQRSPDAIVLGGFSMATTKLSQRIKEIISNGENVPRIPVVFVPDDLARIYQHTEKEWETQESLAPLHKYCLALARYAISPVNEFAAMSADISEFRFQDNDFDVNVIPQEKRLIAYERALVDVVNKVGVDINRTVTDEYYRTLLPFVGGLGPRKARVLVERINTMGGALMNRQQFITNQLLTSKIFMNASGFLRIPQESMSSRNQSRADDENAQDPLDDTRVHPEDYDLARKMAADALDVDEEDTRDAHPSSMVMDLLNERDIGAKLAELALDGFAYNLFVTNGSRKRHTLSGIRDELLLRGFAEQREPFVLPDEWRILGMLSGENRRTLRKYLIIAVQVIRTFKGMAQVRLQSGVDGQINASDDAMIPFDSIQKGRPVQAVIQDVELDKDQDRYLVQLSLSRAEMSLGDRKVGRVQPDHNWNSSLQERNDQLQARKKRAEANKTRRVIKHPNFHNFNTVQAESYLENQPVGDVIIRPSSQGFDHLAITWKVEHGLYQHIDVVDRGIDANGQSAGGPLEVKQKVEGQEKLYVYSDLDELIVNHVQAMARRVEELMQHDRFKKGTEDDLHIFLKNYVAANPAKSMYGFTLNRKRPGHFNLCFLPNSKSSVQTWPVRVGCDAYYLFDAAAVGVNELCDAFKVRHLHMSQTAAAGGYGAGGRTPARIGAATPGYASVRQPARTPNPYGAPGVARTPNPYAGGTTPRNPAPPSSYNSGYPPPPAEFGGGWGGQPQAPYQAPVPPAQYGYPPQPQPAGMNPQRAAMIQNSGGWGAPSNGSGWGS